MRASVCPECGTYSASARVTEDACLSAWWLVPAAISASLVIAALFVAFTVGHRSISSSGQASSIRLLSEPKIEQSRIVRGITLSELRLIANGEKHAPFVPSDLRPNGDRRFRLDMVEAPLIVTALSQIDGTISSEFQMGWPVAWLIWRSDRTSPDLKQPPSSVFGKPQNSRFQFLWFMSSYSTFPSSEVTTSLLLLHTSVLVAPLIGFGLFVCARLAWKRFRADSLMPIGTGWLFVLFVLPFVLWPRVSTDLCSCVSGPRNGLTAFTASDVFVMQDSPEDSRRIAQELVRALSAAGIGDPDFVIGYGYSDFPISAGPAPQLRLPFSVDEYSVGIFNLMRVWQVDADDQIPPGRFASVGPMGEVFFRTQSSSGVGTTILSTKSILVLISLCLAPFMAIRLWRIARADRLNRRHDMSSCLHCGYDLRTPAAPAR